MDPRYHPTNNLQILGGKMYFYTGELQPPPYTGVKLASPIMRQTDIMCFLV